LVSNVESNRSFVIEPRAEKRASPAFANRLRASLGGYAYH
jgi:hypothetical protein